ncbi:MAG: hypothetical protein CMB64_04160 [Euryarchaeota archaeon]|nr:hypothetical protein [Euryarchaeota archaeon]
MINRFITMKLSQTLILFLYSFMSFSQVEQQKYNIIKSIEGVEIRNYPPAIYASVTLDQANNNSLFRILAGYIFGGNNENQKIAMTAPVHMQEQNEGTNESVTMKFVMPSDFEFNDLSKPDDPRIEMFKSDEKKYAAISYSGYNNQEKFNLYSSKLRNILLENNLTFTGTPIYLGYDAPYKFWNRKNEVLIELSD